MRPPTGGILPYTGEGPLRRSPMSALFLKSSALTLLVFDHWNKGKHDFRVSCFHSFPRSNHYEVLRRSLIPQFFQSALPALS